MKIIVIFMAPIYVFLACLLWFISKVFELFADGLYVISDYAYDLAFFTNRGYWPSDDDDEL
jgi:hypothetical protein